MSQRHDQPLSFAMDRTAWPAGYLDRWNAAMAPGGTLRRLLEGAIGAPESRPVERCPCCGHDPHAPGKCNSVHCQRKTGNCEGPK